MTDPDPTKISWCQEACAANPSTARCCGPPRRLPARRYSRRSTRARRRCRTSTPTTTPTVARSQPRVSDLRKRLADADAVLFCTPEYAGALPGSFKNLLDWTVGGGETYGKPVGVDQRSSRLNPEAGSGAHESLRTVLGYTGTDVVAAACRRIQVPRNALDAHGLVGDVAIRDEIGTAVKALADYAGGKLSVRSARLDERAALEDLQRRSSMHEPMYRKQLAAHPDAIELPAAQIQDGPSGWPSRGASSSASRSCSRPSPAAPNSTVSSSSLTACGDRHRAPAHRRCETNRARARRDADRGRGQPPGSRLLRARRLQRGGRGHHAVRVGAAYVPPTRSLKMDVLWPAASGVSSSLPGRIVLTVTESRRDSVRSPRRAQC